MRGTADGRKDRVSARMEFELPYGKGCQRVALEPGRVAGTTTREELVGKFGAEVVASEKIVVHDCDDTKNLVRLGTLPSGGDLVVNRLAAEADLLVAEGCQSS